MLYRTLLLSRTSSNAVLKIPLRWNNWYLEPLEDLRWVIYLNSWCIYWIYMVTDKIAKQILKTYKEAWVGQNISKILSIFNKKWIYHEKFFKKPFKGHKEIAKYWQKKVLNEQSEIRFKLASYYICGDTVIAEWDASFYSNIKKARLKIREIAILKIKGNKIQSLREYWHTKK